jgi:hypothetical protein
LSLRFSALDADVLEALIAEIKVPNVDGLIVVKDKFKITQWMPRLQQESFWLKGRESHSCHKCHKPNPMNR